MLYSGSRKMSIFGFYKNEEFANRLSDSKLVKK